MELNRNSRILQRLLFIANFINGNIIKKKLLTPLKLIKSVVHGLTRKKKKEKKTSHLFGSFYLESCLNILFSMINYI